MSAQQRSKLCNRRAPLAFEFLVVIDFECTCEAGAWDYGHEIIEFPAVLVRCAEAEVVAEFHTFVRPTENRTLSAFCTGLTGIDQSTVDAAPPLLEALEAFDAWLSSHGLLPPGALGAEAAAELRTFALATDGPWDLNAFLAVEGRRKGGVLAAHLAARPHFARWVNLRWLHAAFYSRPLMGVKACLGFHGLAFEGREHSGIDDTRNIARIAQRLLRDGSTAALNDGLTPEHAVAWRPLKRKKGGGRKRGAIPPAAPPAPLAAPP